MCNLKLNDAAIKELPSLRIQSGMESLKPLREREQGLMEEEPRVELGPL